MTGISSASTFDFTANPGAIINSSFSVVPNKITSLDYISPFIVKLTQENFDNQDQATQIGYQIQIPSQIQPGTYYTRIIVTAAANKEIVCGNTTVDYNYTHSEIENTIIITVNSIKNYSVSSFNTTLNVDSPANGTIAYVFSNTGNKELSLKVFSEGKYIKQSQTIYIPAFSNYSMTFLYDIPRDTVGTQTDAITIQDVTGDPVLSNMILSNYFNISDKTAPNISLNITTANVTYGEEFEICWKASDAANIRVNNLYFLGKNLTVSDSGCTKLLANTTGQEPLSIESIDNNYVLGRAEITVNISKVHVSILTKTIKFKTIKPNSKTIEIVFSVDKPMIIGVSSHVQYINLGENVTETRAPLLTLESNNVKTLLDASPINNISVSGNVYLAIEGPITGSYSAWASFNLPVWASENDFRIDFDGEIKSYGVCRKGTENLWGQEFSSEPFDSGIEEDSYCLLSGRFPIDTDFTKDVQPCSLSEEQKYLNTTISDYERIVADKNSEIDLRNWIIGIMLFIMIVSCIIVAFMIKTKGWKGKI